MINLTSLTDKQCIRKRVK